MTTTVEHFLDRRPYSGAYGDRPEPWEVTFTCGGCGEELAHYAEDLSDPVVGPDEAFQEHLDELNETLPTNDEE